MNQYLDPVPEGTGLVVGSHILPRVGPPGQPQHGVEDRPADSVNFLSSALFSLQAEQGSPTAAAETFWPAVYLLAAWLGKWRLSFLHLPTTLALSLCCRTGEGHPEA